MGVLYYEENNNIKARECFEQQIKNVDYYAEPYYYLSLIDIRENKKLEAKQKIEKAIDYYSKSKFMKDTYTNIIDKVYEEKIKIFNKKLDN